MSRFLPNLYVDQAMKKLGMQDDSLQVKIKKYTEVGVKRLAELQNPDGSWGWWGGNKGDGRMTAYVMGGLNYALRHGYKINKESYNKGREALKRMFNQGSESLNTVADMAHTYYLIWQEKDQLLGKKVSELYKGRKNLSTQARALLLEICHGLGQKERIKTILAGLEKIATTTGKYNYWTGTRSYWWHSQDIEATALVLRALMLSRPRHRFIPGIVSYLSLKRRRGYWVSTKTTAKVINALSLYLEGTGELDPEYTGKIIADGKELRSFTVTKKDLKNWQGTIKYQAAGSGLDHEFVMSKNGQGRLYYTITLSYCNQEEIISAQGKELTLTRKYTRLVYTKDKEGEWVIKRKPFKGSLKTGEELEVSVTLKSNGNYEHLLLEDFFPQGTEVEKKEPEYYSRWCRWWYWDYSHSEARDDRMVYFLDYVYSGERTFTYILRAETPGLFHALPSVAQLMYNPEIQGNSKEDIITITE
jgi:uncharacterized protein YfaS (alpha-2-macroglobulin family)